MNFIPIWGICDIIFPNEIYNIHIQEDEIKNLVTDCYGEDKPFGVIPIINGRQMDTGTTVNIKEVVDVSSNGEMDIIVEGDKIFNVLEQIHQLPQKLYKGAIVSYPENLQTANVVLTPKILSLIKEMHRIFHFDPQFLKNDDGLKSYDFAKVVGISLEEQYTILTYLEENHRLEFIRRHLVKYQEFIKEFQKSNLYIQNKSKFKRL